MKSGIEREREWRVVCHRESEERDEERVCRVKREMKRECEEWKERWRESVKNEEREMKRECEEWRESVKEEGVCGV